MKIWNWWTKGDISKFAPTIVVTGDKEDDRFDSLVVMPNVKVSTEKLSQLLKDHKIDVT